MSSNNNSAASATANAALTGGASANSLIANALSAYAYSQGGTSFAAPNAFLAGGGNTIGG